MSRSRGIHQVVDTILRESLLCPKRCRQGIKVSDARGTNDTNRTNGTIFKPIQVAVASADVSLGNCWGNKFPFAENNVVKRTGYKFILTSAGMVSSENSNLSSSF